MGAVGQLSDPYQQGQDDELGITISGLPGDLHEPDPPGGDPVDRPVDGAAASTATDGGDGGEQGDGAEEGDDESLVYDLADWSDIERQAIDDRLREAGIPHGWEGASLVVAAADEAPVENVLDLVEGEADEPLDEARDKVAYDLSEWDDDLLTNLVRELRSAGIAFAWDDVELYVYSDDEDAVDNLIDRVSHPHELAAEDDDGAPGAELLGEMFVAADRLQRDPQDPDGILVVLEKGEALDPQAPPYGLGVPEWTHLCERVTGLAELLAADPVDEDEVVAAARDLRTALRPYV